MINNLLVFWKSLEEFGIWYKKEVVFWVYVVNIRLKWLLNFIVFVYDVKVYQFFCFDFNYFVGNLFILGWFKNSKIDLIELCGKYFE